MKVRNGFVSNSSSSSFLIVGLSLYDGKGICSGEALIEKMYPGIFDSEDKYEDYDSGGHGDWSNDVFDMFGGEDGPQYIGINAEKYLKKDKTVSQIKEIFIKKAAKAGVIVKPEECDLYFDEAYSG